VGEAYIAVADSSGGRSERVEIPHVGTAQVPSREQIRAATVRAALELLDEWAR
jgi:nicotinamide mononucleotide (NMN) deamidase PncC